MGVALGRIQIFQTKGSQAAARHTVLPLVPSEPTFKRAGLRRTGRRLMTKPWPLSIPRPRPIFETNRKATPWQVEMALQRRREQRTWAAAAARRERRRQQSRPARPGHRAPHLTTASPDLSARAFSIICTARAASVSTRFSRFVLALLSMAPRLYTCKMHVHVRSPGKVGRGSAAGYVPPPPLFPVPNSARELIRYALAFPSCS